jgi:hypothetical protein
MYIFIFTKITNNYLAFLLNKDYHTFNQLSPVQSSGQFLSVGTIHLLKWHPPVCDVEIFMKGGCYYG